MSVMAVCLKDCPEFIIHPREIWFKRFNGKFRDPIKTRRFLEIRSSQPKTDR
jgi:hypothetical protein